MWVKRWWNGAPNTDMTHTQHFELEILCYVWDEWNETVRQKWWDISLIYRSRKYMSLVGIHKFHRSQVKQQTTIIWKPAAIRSHLLRLNGLQMKYLWCEPFYALTRWRNLWHMCKLNHFVRQMLFYINFAFAFFSQCYLPNERKKICRYKHSAKQKQRFM